MYESNCSTYGRSYQYNEPPPPSASYYSQPAPVIERSDSSGFQMQMLRLFSLFLLVVGLMVAPCWWYFERAPNDAAVDLPAGLLIDHNTPVIAIMGASGSGKSSLIHALGGRDKDGLLPKIGHGLQSCMRQSPSHLTRFLSPNVSM